jgi:[protein-PII] uridylyltransferase
MNFEEELSSAVGALEAGRDLLLASCSRRVAEDLSLNMARLMDGYFKTRILEAEKEGLFTAGGDLSITAVGGYGRGRLAPFSDIDVLIVTGRKPECNLEDLVSFLLYPLWDLKFDVGHGVRSVKENIKLAASDFKVFTSLLDMRFLAGAPGPAQKLQDELASVVLPSSGNDLVETLWEDRIRKGSDMDCVVLEPELKEGWGGLRDLDFIFWTHRVLRSWGPLGDEDLKKLSDCHKCLDEARSALHLVSGRKKDRLILEMLPDVAALCGIRDYNPARRGEKLLAEIHNSMIGIRSMGDALYREGFCSSCRTIDWNGQDGINGAVSLFRLKSESGLPLSRRARRLVSSIAPSSECNLKKTIPVLIEILRAPYGWKTSLEMLDSGLLSVILPDFSKASRIVPFDGYHQHTPGRHALLAVRNAIKISDDEFSGADGLTGGDIDILVFAALLHDIAKGSSDHSSRGAEIAAAIMEQAGIRGEDSADVIFLIREHLLLVHAARRIDLSDAFSVAELVRKVGSLRRLKMLFVLTVADSMATGPRVWNSWSGGLLRELYSKLYSSFEGRSIGSGEDLILKRRSRIRELGSGTVGKAFLEKSLDSMPERYLLSFDAEAIVKHLHVVKEFQDILAKDMVRKPAGRGGIGVNLVRECSRVRDMVQVVVAAMDQPMLFSTQAGVFSLHGLDVLSAEVFNWSDQTSLNVFTLRRSGDDALPEDVLERAQRSILYAMTGRLALDYRLHKKRSSPLEGSCGAGIPVVISLDNDSSENSTIVEVQTGDRTGLLYDISQVFSRMNAEIKMARICTSGVKVFDAFHLCGVDGRKIVDNDHLEELVQALKFASCPRN